MRLRSAEELELELIEMKIKKLKQQRNKILKMQRKMQLDEGMVELYEIVKHYPGACRAEIEAKMEVNSPKDYNNKMTALRRKGMLVNRGTRSHPEWYIA
jgi:hypothetical protein